MNLEARTEAACKGSATVSGFPGEAIQELATSAAKSISANTSQTGPWKKETKMHPIVIPSVAILIGTVLSFGGTLLDARYFEFPNALPGKILKLQKSIDSETGRVTLVSSSAEVATVADLIQVEALEAAGQRAARGSLDERLAERLPTLGLLETVRVGVRIKRGSFVHLDKTRYTQQELIENSQAYLAQTPVNSPLAVLARYGLLAASMRGNDIVIAYAGRSVLEALKVDSEVASVWEDVEASNLSPELTTLAASGYNPGSVPSGAGSGVKAATFERGLTSSFLSCIGVTPSAYDTFTLTGADALKRHSHATFRTLVASAPSAYFYHRYSLTYNSTDDVNYIVNNGIQTISMSLDRGGTSADHATYSEFLTMDNMAFSYPYPVFTNPAANSGYTYETNWQCYNCISVGNVRHTSDSYFEMAECTQTKNPPPRYGSCISGSGSDCAGDREMPHIVAPGYPSTGSDFATTCLEGTGTLSCGTSYSAPVANGMAAAAIAADSRLSGWPEKVRATLILTAQNVESGDWTVSGDERDGAGTISGSEAVAFASGHTSVSPSNTACEKGMGANSFYASDFSANKRFNFLVPNPKPSGKHLRVVLTWDSNPNVSNGTNDLSDLDLVVQKNGGTTSSSSWDSNVEVVDVAAADLTAGNSYYIDLAPYANRIPSGSYFYYAIAWGWVKDHAP